ncbi:MAG: hypothetical protein HS111_34820 [Kofleriaceae bacterium]|nr:hypothetical protein [Kofleriaceae bacterium]
MDESMTDDQHIQYMLDGDDRGRIEQLYEMQTAWGFGGAMLIHKEQPLVLLGRDEFPLRRRSEFYAERFDVSLGAAAENRRACGFAVWFRRGSDPLRPRSRADRTLCGWVELERESEAASWIRKLNAAIQANLDRAGAPSAEQELEVATQVHTQGTAALLRGIGVPLPEVDSMDSIVDELGKMDADSPLPGRRLRATPVEEPPPAPAPSEPVAATPVPGALRYVGNFVELGYEHHANPPSIVAARGKRKRAHKAEVLAYLRKARPVTMSPGINQDFFDPTKTVRGETTRTDGVYIWGDFLADYVDRYDVALPDEFEQHMESREWRLPENLDVRSLKKPW